MRPELRWFAPDIYDALGNALRVRAEGHYKDLASGLDRGMQSKFAASYTAAAYRAYLFALPAKVESPLLYPTVLTLGIGLVIVSGLLAGVARLLVAITGLLILVASFGVFLREGRGNDRLVRTLNARFGVDRVPRSPMSRSTQAKFAEIERLRGLPTEDGWPGWSPRV